MIAAVVLGLALMSSEGGLSRPQLLEAKAACRLTKGSKLPSGVVYSISGTYRRGTHWSSLEVPGCEKSIAAAIQFRSEASAKISDYHSAFEEKCGSALMDDYVSGVFTGKFVRRDTELFGMHAMPDIFIISDIETKGLDPASITCAK